MHRDGLAVLGELLATETGADDPVGVGGERAVVGADVPAYTLGRSTAAATESAASRSSMSMGAMLNNTPSNGRPSHQSIVVIGPEVRDTEPGLLLEALGVAEHLGGEIDSDDRGAEPRREPSDATHIASRGPTVPGPRLPWTSPANGGGDGVAKPVTLGDVVTGTC